VLGRFLRALHDTPVPAGVPGDRIGRTDLRRRAAMVPEKLARAGVSGAGVAQAVATVRHLAETAPHAGPPRLVHGDLYVRHLLLDEARAPCGVIDWGDVHAGDPALDLSLAFTFLPEPARGALLDAYGPVDDDTLARARFKALFYAATFLEYGRARQDADLVRAGETALRFALP
jgi:aminoglycoside phosphotransferase (APT) family kinase protein